MRSFALFLAFIATLGMGAARPTRPQLGAGSHLERTLERRITINASFSIGDIDVDLDLSTESLYESTLPALREMAGSSQVMGQYWPNWQSTQTPSQLSWSYADLAWYFVLETCSTGFSLDGASSSGMSDFVSAAHAEGKTALVTVGGWTGSVYFSSLVASNASRYAFAEQIVDLVQEYNFDGVDIDWEYPGTQGAGSNEVSTSDSSNFLLFLQAVRALLGDDRVITAAVPADGFTGSDGSHLTDTSEFAAVLDFITVMAYDNYGSSYSSTTGPNAPLKTCIDGGPSDEKQIAAWIATGFPASQILLGVPSYSHLFKTASSTLTTTSYGRSRSLSFQKLAASQPADPQYTYSQLISQGYLSSDGLTGRNGFQRIWDNCTSTPFLWDADSQIWISYEDGESAALKADYARRAGLAGVGFYDSTGFKESGLKRIAEGLKGVLTAGTTDDEVPLAGESGSVAISVGATVYLEPFGAASTSTSSKAPKVTATGSRARATTTMKVTSSSTTKVWPSSSSATSSSSSRSEWSYVAPSSSPVWWTSGSVTSTAPATTTTPPSGVWTVPAAEVKVLTVSALTSSRASKSASSKVATSIRSSSLAKQFTKSVAQGFALSLAQAPASTRVQGNDLAAALVFGSTSSAPISASTAVASDSGKARVIVLAKGQESFAASATPAVARRAWSSRPQHRAAHKLL